MRQWMIDAFARAPFKGNPACVVEPLGAWPSDAAMQALASENNQAETAFLERTDDPARFGLRWFTPSLEAPLCGHATLASAHALFAELGVAVAELTFDTLSGPLIVGRAARGYRMDFPAGMPQRIEAPAGLAEALGATPQEVWAERYLIAVFTSEDEVRALAPDLAALKSISGAATQGRGNVGASALARPGADYDVVSRFFAPGSGVGEDPTTGSLHCSLAPLYAQKLGQPRVAFHQAYPGRGGDLVGEVRGERVWLDGEAVTIAESELRIAL
ncbi:MAG TPA: PhzF family phenazine biosynthesis protein [Caulobacteraceae bacterium]|jgi:PhzF family phenazine biosynthesis protein